MPLQGKVLGSVPSRHFMFDILNWSFVCRTGVLDMVASKYYHKYFSSSSKRTDLVSLLHLWVGTWIALFEVPHLLRGPGVHGWGHRFSLVPTWWPNCQMQVKGITHPFLCSLGTRYACGAMYIRTKRKMAWPVYLKFKPTYRPLWKSVI